MGDVWNWFSGLDFTAQAIIVGAILLFLFGSYCYGQYEQQGERVIWTVPASIIRPLFFLLPAAVMVGVLRMFGRDVEIPEWIKRSWTRPDPHAAKIPQKTVKPMKFPDKELAGDEFYWKGEKYKRNATVIVAPPESAKDDGLIGPALKYELQYGTADLTWMDPKAQQLAFAINNGYLMRPDTDVYIYNSVAGMSAQATHTFNLFALSALNPQDSLTVMRRITEAPSIDPHWQELAANGMWRLQQDLSEDGNAASLSAVAQVMADPSLMQEVIAEGGKFAGTAGNEKEWGGMRSEANKALVLLDPDDGTRTGRVFSGVKTKMPNYASPRRQIAVFCPDPYSGDIEQAMWAAALEVVIQLHAKQTPLDRYHKAYINEAGSFMSIPRIPTYLEICRSAGLRLATVFQSESQVVRQHSQELFDSIWDSSPIRLVGANASPDLADRVIRYTAPVRQERHGPRQLGPDSQGRQVQDQASHEVQQHHITRQKIGRWTMLVGPEAFRFKVPKHAGQRAVLAEDDRIPPQFQPKSQ